MKYFSKEDMVTLSTYEKELERAYKQNWKMFTRKEQDKLLVGIYEKTTGTKLYTNNYCANCMLKAYIKIGELYFLTKAKNEKAAAKAALKKSVKNNE